MNHKVRYTVLPCKPMDGVKTIGVFLSHGYRLFGGYLGVVGLFAFWLVASTFSFFVQGVVSLCAKKHMGRVYALRVIAMVTDANGTADNATKGKLIRKTVRFDVPFPSPKVTIPKSVFCSRPFPTLSLCSLVYFVPKAFDWVVWFSHGFVLNGATPGISGFLATDSRARGDTRHLTKNSLNRLSVAEGIIP
jgi:hypothetical protein